MYTNHQKALLSATLLGWPFQWRKEYPRCNFEKSGDFSDLHRKNGFNLRTPPEFHPNTSFNRTLGALKSDIDFSSCDMNLRLQIFFQNKPVKKTLNRPIIGTRRLSNTISSLKKHEPSTVCRISFHFFPNIFVSFVKQCLILNNSAIQKNVSLSFVLNPSVNQFIHLRN